MRAIDTNVLARLIMQDDPQQLQEAKEIIENGAFVLSTVLIELVWVLKTNYRLDRAEISRALLDVLDLDSFKLIDREAMAWTIERYTKGADFADMIHLNEARRHATSFATFDRDIARKAGDTPPIPIETLGA